ncbi:digeranylgeranylglyceryl phosphate synthase protein [Rutstroemia sp. NJR-2017a BBW]|nr:digeranylgeranylglyceryl phosphate synthase protein [Rutstroemia sp. NJR-2017a BBW]
MWGNFHKYWKLLGYQGYSIWLFTRSDFKTIVGPSTAFGIFNILAFSAYNLQPSDICFTHPFALLRLIAKITFWVWINLLPFAIDNQLSPKAMSEDAVNKLWRTLPSKRMTPQQAGALRAPLYACAAITSWQLGGLRQCLSLLGLGIWYNHLGGSDTNAVIRNFINSAGYVCYTSGALEVASGTRWLPEGVFPWFGLLGMVVFTTVQMQDFGDQAGDTIRDRKTLPLQIGDRPARCITAALVPFWSCICAQFWRLSVAKQTPVLILGCCIAYRLLSRISAEQDKTTFRVWNLWMVALYMMPLLYVSPKKI